MCCWKYFWSVITFFFLQYKWTNYAWQEQITTKIGHKRAALLLYNKKKDFVSITFDKKQKRLRK